LFTYFCICFKSRALWHFVITEVREFKEGRVGSGGFEIVEILFTHVAPGGVDLHEEERGFTLLLAFQGFGLGPEVLVKGPA